MAPDLSNVPADYHAALVEAVQGLAMDPTMPPGSERSMAIGDRLFVFTKPMPAIGIPPGAVWVTRMTDVGSGSMAATGYGSGPLWPVDIVDGRNPPRDRRYVGSPTIYDGAAQAVLSPDPVPLETMMPGMMPGGFVSPMAVVGGDGLAEAVAAAPMGGAQATPEIFGASRPDIVGADSEIAAIPPPPFGLMDDAIPPPPVGLSEEANAVAQHDPMAVPPMMDPEAIATDRRAAMRPTPSAYVLIRPSDSVWPVKLAKIGSGNRRSFDQLIALNPHLVPMSGNWPQMFAGDEVNVPMQWVEALRRKGFLVKMDAGLTN